MKKFFTLLAALLFTGSLLTAQTYYSEDFEAGIPADWTADAIWVHGTAAAISSAYFSIPNHTMIVGVNDDGPGAGVDQKGMIYSGQISLAGAEYPILNFASYFVNGDYQGADETAKVFVSTDGGANWTEVYDLPGGGDWAETRVPLFDYAGMNILVGFEYDDGTGWNFGFCIDDVTVEEYPVKRDAEVLYAAATCIGQGLIGQPFGVQGLILNNGTDEINSFDINYSINGTDYSETVSGVSIPLFDNYSFKLEDVGMVTNGTTNVDVWISNVNGEGADEDPLNDEGTSASIAGIEMAENRGVLVEEATGTWCGWCPRGAVWMDRMASCFGEHFVGVAVHNSDPMVLAAYDNGVTGFPGFTGFPSVIVERQTIVDPSALQSPVVTRGQEEAVAVLDITADFDESNGQLTVTVSATPMEDMSGSYRLNAILSEDGVSGTNSGYNQVNYYAGGGVGAMAGYEFLPGSIPAAQMVYDHVGRALLGGFTGASGSLPADMTAGETYSYTFTTYTIPSSMNWENMHIAAVMHDANNNGRSINAWQKTVLEATTVGTKDVIVNHDLARVAPNPFNDVTNVYLSLEAPAEVNMRVFNAVGQEIAARNYGTLNGQQVLPFDGTRLDAGVYFIHLMVDNTLVTKKVMLAK